jgi:hypothetical protein
MNSYCNILPYFFCSETVNTKSVHLHILIIFLAKIGLKLISLNKSMTTLFGFSSTNGFGDQVKAEKEKNGKIYDWFFR